jgi:hypothetical protein
MRAALRIEEAYRVALQAESAQLVKLKGLTRCISELHRTTRRIHLARRHNLQLAGAMLSGDFQMQLSALGQEANQLGNGRALAYRVPRLRDIFLDLEHLQSEFEEVRVDWDAEALVAVTPPIELEDVYLGRFAIELHWNRLARFASGCFDIVALDPQPAEANESVTHPHVRDSSLCPGDADSSLRRALEQGRVADAFLMVRSVLTHYNVRSAYVALSDWDGVRCSSCECFTAREDCSTCAECGGSYCDDCISACSSCDVSSCADCLSGCTCCGATACDECLSRVGDERLCSNCLRTCPACEEEVARDEIDAETGWCNECVQRHEEQEDSSETNSAKGMQDEAITSDISAAEAGVRSPGLAEASVHVPPGTD